MQTRGLWRAFVLVVAIALISGAAFVAGTGRVLAGNTDNPLQEFQTVGACTDTAPYRIAVAGVGMTTTNHGTINLSLPPTATVYKAYLYWTGRDPFDQGDPTIQFEGVGFYGDQYGGPAFWGTNDFAYAYRADVTTYVSPSKSSYTFSDPFTGDPDQFDISYGAALVVIYQDSAASWPNIAGVWEGMDIAEGASAPVGSEGISPVTIQFDPAAVNRTMHLTTVVGGIFSGTDASVYYLVGSGTPPSGDIYSLPGVQTLPLPPSEDGMAMTTYDFDVTVPAGSEWVIVQVKSEDPNAAPLHWLAQTYEMEAACPMVEVTKTLTEPAGGLAHVGDAITFDIAVRNVGNTLLTTVPLTDTYDTSYLSFSSASVAPDDPTDDGQLNWSDITAAVGDMNPGETKHVTVSFTAVASTQSLVGDVTTNTAVSSATDENGKTAPEDSDSADVEISNPSIAITKERLLPEPPDGIATVGETVQFSIVVTNTGDTVLNTVPLTDTYDTTYLAFQSASPAPDDTTDDGVLNWANVGPLNPGESTTVIVTFQAKASTWNGSEHVKTHNYAEVSATDENGDTVGPKEDTAWVKITHPAVTISKVRQGDAYAPINGQVTYTIFITNTGDTVLNTVPVVDTFPTDYLNYHSDTSGQTPSVDESAGTVTWADVTGSGSLGVGESLSFDVVFQVTASSNPDTITNTACVESAEDANGDHPDNVCDDDNTVITTNPSLTITKERLTDSPVLVGDTVQFRITITNTGDTAVTVLPLTDSFDEAHLAFVSATPSPDSAVRGTLTWNDLTGGGDLAPGASIQVDLTFNALSSTTGSGPTVDTATVSGAEDEHGDTVPEVSDTADVAILTPASIGDFVWEDTNGNGIQDAGEPGIAGVTVHLYTGGGTLVATTTTNASGEYLFDHLFPGDYYLVFEKPTGYEFTAQDQGTDNAVDSDADSSGQTATTTLTEGENDTSWDAGLYRPASVGDYVWEDVNGNGIQDSGEPGIGGVTVNLHYAGPNGAFGDGDDTTATTTTNSSGEYTFTNLPPGNYKVEFVTPTGYVITFQDQGSDDTVDSDPDPATGMTAQFSLSSGESDVTWDAGMYRPVTIGDFVWQDTDGDGVQDPGENGIPGVSLSLTCAGLDGTMGTPDDITDSTTTDSNGVYQFTNLPPGTCQVDVSTPSGYVATTSTSWTGTLVSGETRDDADFGFISPTAVELMDFQAEVSDAGVHLTWRTYSETGITGFRVQRALVPFGPWKNVLYVPAQGSGSTYSVYDRRIEPGFTYYYRLVTEPESQELGPWTVYVPKTWEPGAGIQSGYRLFVPMVSR